MAFSWRWILVALTGTVLVPLTFTLRLSRIRNAALAAFAARWRPSRLSPHV